MRRAAFRRDARDAGDVAEAGVRCEARGATAGRARRRARRVIPGARLPDVHVERRAAAPARSSGPARAQTSQRCLEFWIFTPEQTEPELEKLFCDEASVVLARARRERRRPRRRRPVPAPPRGRAARGARARRLGEMRVERLEVEGVLRRSRQTRGAAESREAAAAYATSVAMHGDDRAARQRGGLRLGVRRPRRLPPAGRRWLRCGRRPRRRRAHHARAHVARRGRVMDEKRNGGEDRRARCNGDDTVRPAPASSSVLLCRS